MDIAPFRPVDAGELLTLQRAAFVTEAQLYGDPRLPALVETIEELIAAVQRGPALVARTGSRAVGSVRTRIEDGVLHVGRLVVAPDQQGRGIGAALLSAVERAAGPGVRSAALFTGHRSAGLRLYARAGYVEQRRQRVDDALTLVHLAKPLG